MKDENIQENRAGKFLLRIEKWLNIKLQLEIKVSELMRKFLSMDIIFTEKLIRIRQRQKKWNFKLNSEFDPSNSGRSTLINPKYERGDVPGWVLVVLMTAGLVTGIWTVAAPRLNLILRNSLDSMNAIR